MVQIRRIGIKQTAKVVAVFYFLISLVFVLPISVVTLLIGSSANKSSSIFPAAFGGVLLLVMPVIYAVLGFVIVVLSAALYNLVARYVGGVEIEFNSEKAAEAKKEPEAPPLSEAPETPVQM